MSRLFIAAFIFLICVNSAFAQTQVRLKLADGSYMTVDDAWESPQGVWYRRGGLSNVRGRGRGVAIVREGAFHQK
jgi:hypothetical protein